MGLFKSSKSHAELLQSECQEVASLAARVRKDCEQSLRGKYEYMAPEDRVGLLKDARGTAKRLHAALADARQRKAEMEKEESPSEALLAAESILLSAELDVRKADQTLREGETSLISGVSEIEEFYGPRSKEAKHLRKLITEFEASS